MNYETPGTLPLFIRRIIEQEEAPARAVERITSALPYWSVTALHRGALADRDAYQGGNYRERLDNLIQYTGEAYNG